MVTEHLKAAALYNPSPTANNIFRLQKTQSKYMTDSLGLLTYHLQLFRPVTKLIVLV